MSTIFNGGGGVGGASFSTITGGINTAALVVGTGGSLTPTGTGVITATNATTPFTIGGAGQGNAVLGLAGNTSGIATFTAPAVAGSIGNGVTMSNALLGPNTGAASPTYAFSSSSSTGLFSSNGTRVSLASQGTTVLDASSGFMTVFVPFNTSGGASNITSGGSLTATTFVNTATYQTATNCAQNTVSPAACGSASSGVFAIPASATTYTVNTSAVTANSRIFLQPTTDNTGIPSAPTCVDPALTAATSPSARVAATSFTLQLTANAGITCYNYWIVN
jgi:hypothetical protein